MNSFLILAALLPVAIAQTCSNGGIGGCLNNRICPALHTCLNSGTANAICCANANVVGGTGTGTGTVYGNCVDKINPRTGVSDCPSRAYLCNDSVYYTLMTEQCPRTCGRCNGSGNYGNVVTATRASTNCVDLTNPATGRSDCPNRAYLCNDSVYYTLMTQQCPRTCGRCNGSGTVVTATRGGSTNCVDLTNPATGRSDCPSRANLCNNSVYYTLMTEQCPRTCGRCNVGK